ncbi:peptidase M16, partial [Staphylococcus aureus]|nr:peptidase M16 [Staphylococcus aureus]
QYVQHDLEMTLFFELVLGEETDFYQTLLNEDLIDESFGYQFVLEPTYCFSIITSATQHPNKLKEVLLNELNMHRGKLKDQEA